LERAGIEPVLQSVNRRWAVSAAALWPSNIRVANFVGTVQAVAIPGKVDPGPAEVSIVARHHEERESGDGFLDQVELPVAEDFVGGAAPAAAEVLAFAKRQVVEHADGKLIVAVQLRQAPLQLVRARQRPIHGAGERAETVRKFGI